MKKTPCIRVAKLWNERELESWIASLKNVVQAALKQELRRKAALILEIQRQALNL